MSELTIQGLRPKLLERLQRLAQLQGCEVDAVVSEALTIGIDAVEDRVRKQLLNTREQVALKEAIEEIKKVPDGAFGKIGKLIRGE